MRPIWLKMSVRPERIEQLKTLGKMNARAVEVWFITLIYVVNNEGRISWRLLSNELISNHMSRQKLLEVLLQSGDFDYDKAKKEVVLTDRAKAEYFGNSRTVPPEQSENSRTVPPEQSENPRTAPPGQSENPRTAPPSLTPASCSTNLEEKENKKEKEGEGEDAGAGEAAPAPTTTTAEENAIRLMVERLTEGTEHQAWRERSLMQHPLLREMLEGNFRWCLHYFLNHALVQGHDLALYSVAEAKSYFTNFCRNPATRDALVRDYRAAFDPPSEQSSEEASYQQWLRQTFPRVATMQEPLTQAEYWTLRRRLDDDRQRLHDLLERVNNTAGLHSRYVSAFATAKLLLNKT